MASLALEHDRDVTRAIVQWMVVHGGVVVTTSDAMHAHNLCKRHRIPPLSLLCVCALPAVRRDGVQIASVPRPLPVFASCEREIEMYMEHSRTSRMLWKDGPVQREYHDEWRQISTSHPDVRPCGDGITFTRPAAEQISQILTLFDVCNGREDDDDDCILSRKYHLDPCGGIQENVLEDSIVSVCDGLVIGYVSGSKTSSMCMMTMTLYQ